MRFCEICAFDSKKLSITQSQTISLRETGGKKMSKIGDKINKFSIYLTFSDDKSKVQEFKIIANNSNMYITSSFPNSLARNLY